MKKLKVKPDWWLLSYTKGKSLKQISYICYGFDVIDVCNRHISNPNYADTKIVGVVQILDEE